MKLDEKNYVDLAEKVIKGLLEDKKKLQEDRKKLRGKEDETNDTKIVTTSKLRKLLAMISDIYNDIVGTNSETLTDEVIGRINYLKIRFLYEAGRDANVKNLVEKAELLKHLDDIKESKRQFILFSRYMEALVAYRKYLGAEAGDEDKDIE